MPFIYGGGVSDATRLTTAERTATVWTDGHLVYDTQLDALYVGDGTTAGGVAVGGGGGGGGTWGSITGTLSAQTDLQSALDAKLDDSGFNFNQFFGTDGTGAPTTIPGWGIDTTSGGSNISLTEEPNGSSSNLNVHSQAINLEPLASSPNETWGLQYNQISLDTANSGLAMGTAGQVVKFHVNNLVHNGSSDVGTIDFIQNNFSVGNGTDPIDVKGFGYIYGFGQFNANVNIVGAFQGYGFQPNVNAAATMDTSAYTNAFYDFSNIGCASPGYSSFSSGPIIDEIQNNGNYTGISINPTINTFTGNSGCFGIAVNGNLGTFDTGSFTGVNINPTIALVKNAYGLNITMDNVTVFAGVVGTLVIQDLTIESNNPDEAANSMTFAYTSGATAGAEVVSGAYPAIQVQIESGVSTATQIETALNAYLNFTANFNVTVSGVGSNPQVTQAATSMSGALYPGTKKAAYLDGDVEITGSLTFGGSLSIGALNAFASQPLVDGGGTPASIHSLITNPTVAASTTIANADLLGVNTAALINIGDNAVVTTAFLGVAALGLPAVLTMGTGSTVDRVAGAVFALSLDVTGTGGTADTVALCRALSIPNGVTTVNRMYGYEFDLPFGDVGTDQWGLYIQKAANNWLEGGLKIGGTAGSSDTPSGHALYVDGSSLFDGNLGFYGTTPIAQPVSSGAATATILYTATEQAMLQQVYDAVRALGLMS